MLQLFLGTPKVSICHTSNFFAPRYRQLVIAFELRVFIELGLRNILEAMLGRIRCAPRPSHLLCLKLVIHSKSKFVWSAATDASTVPRCEPTGDFLEFRILKALIDSTFLPQDCHGID